MDEKSCEFASVKYESLCKWKYRLTDKLEMKTSIRGISCKTAYISLWDNGRLILHKGYAWDGATCCPDVDEIMRGSAGHDALYQLISLGAIPPSKRFDADFDLYNWCKQDGMSSMTAEAVLVAVRAFGGLHT
mgnify:CR=1 FL=1